MYVVCNSNSPSLNCHLIGVEGFACLREPDGKVVGAIAPGRVTQQVVGEGPDYGIRILIIVVSRDVSM